MNLSNKIVVHKKDGNIEYLQFRRLLKYSAILQHAYSLGIDKNYRTYKANKTPLPREEYKMNIDNYRKLCSVNNLNYKNIVKASQAHTDKIYEIKDKKEDVTETMEKVDGLITKENDIILATTNADCILLLFFDPVKKVIANVHSGWKGTLQRISVKTIDKMKNDFECNPKNIIVCICPSIRKCHFEVDEDVYKLFLEQFSKLGNVERFIEKKGEKWYIDTVLINKIILKQAGILEENIEDCGICSVCNKNIIHSFRAEGENYGLATALITIKD